MNRTLKPPGKPYSFNKIKNHPSLFMKPPLLNCGDLYVSFIISNIMTCRQ